jgi:hypothetical protein
VTPLHLDKVGDVAGKAVKGVGDTLEKGAKGVGDAVSNIFGK